MMSLVGLYALLKTPLRVLCDFDFNIVFDPQPEYAKVVNYPYSKLIGYNGIRSIDIIKKIE